MSRLPFLAAAVAALATVLPVSSATAQSLTIAGRLPGKVHLLPATMETTQ